MGNLKEQLKQQLADLEKQEQDLAASMKPQTVSQVDQLIKKLQEALDDLKTQRAVLEKKEAQEKQQAGAKQPPANKK